MRTLSIKASRIMNEIFKDRDLETNPHRKYDNGGEGIMALVTEVIMPIGYGDDSRDEIELVSVAHYYEQNGDLMRDPEMVFKRVRDPLYNDQSLFFPISFQQDNLGLLNESVRFTPDEKSSRWNTSYRRAMQRDQAVFASEWLVNANDQQGLGFDVKKEDDSDG